MHAYLTRQILASLLMTVAVFTFVLLLGNALKDILPLLISGQVSIGAVAEAFGLLIPFAWVFALPMGMLTATLLIFGRFSADQELTAVRASGVSLVSLVTPILLLSLALCGVSALVNTEIGPRCKVAYNNMRFDLSVGLSSALLPEGRFIRDFPGFIFYVGKSTKGGLEDVLVFVLKNETNWTETVQAPRGRIEADETNKRMSLTLYDGKIISRSGGDERTGYFEELPIQLDFNAPSKSLRPKITDMTFTQLWDELAALERTLAPPIDVHGLTSQQIKAKKEEHERRRRELSPILFQIHRQVAFSFACFGFTLIGIPLGIRVHRRETNIGIAIALLLVAVYYSFILLGSALDNRPEFAPHLIVWVPNFLFQAIGAVLLWRANRGV